MDRCIMVETGLFDEETGSLSSRKFMSDTWRQKNMQLIFLESVPPPGLFEELIARVWEGDEKKRILT